MHRSAGLSLKAADPKTHFACAVMPVHNCIAYSSVLILAEAQYLRYSHAQECWPELESCRPQNTLRHAAFL